MITKNALHQQNQTTALHKAQGGFSLIEMMVSMVLGLVLMSGLTIMYINSKDSDRTRQAISDIDANARQALISLREVIQHTGYRSIYNLRFEEPFVTTTTPILGNITCRTKGTLFSSYKNASAYLLPTQDNDNGDRITVAFLADNPNDVNAKVFTDSQGVSIETTDENEGCSADRVNGMSSPLEGRLYATFYVNENRSLLTYGSRSGSTPEPIAENIENMQILYGVTKEGNTIFQNATTVENNSDWLSVTSVKIALLVISDQAVLSQNENRTYQLLDHSVSYNSRNLLRVYTMTINLPNRNEQPIFG